VSRPDRAVFRLPAVSLLIPFLLFVCVTPLANAGAKFWLSLYVLPLLGLLYILLTRTVADAQLIRTTGLLGGHRVPWSNLDGFEFRGQRWGVAVALDGRRTRLPMVRPRDLPRLASVSGGRLLLESPAPDDSPGREAGGPEELAEEVTGENTMASPEEGQPPAVHTRSG